MSNENRFSGIMGYGDVYLSGVQRETLAALCQFVRKNGYAPTQKELADRLGMSEHAIFRRLNILRVRGYIEHSPRKWRSIRIVRWV